MTNRLNYPTPWASGGTARDPDLDTTHPSYIADRYATVGWGSEKLPEEWQNFLSQISDDKIIERIVKGIVEFDSTVTYTEGAVYARSDKWYKIEGGVEKEILSINTAEYSNLISILNGLITSHLSADNPHNDTIGGLVGGGYEKPAVDDAFGSPTDPKTIVYHKGRVGVAAHGETPEQLGTLPVTGGKFTGDVVFLEGLVVNPGEYLHFNKATAFMEMVNGLYALGVDALGNGYVYGPTGGTLVLSEANFDNLAIKYNNSFALPTPIISINLELSLCDADSVGDWTITTTTDPVFEDGKGFVVQDTNTLSGVDIPSAHTILVRGFKTADVAYITDSPLSKSYRDLNDLVNSGAVSVTNIKQVVIYPPLTTYQKSMLVNS